MNTCKEINLLRVLDDAKDSCWRGGLQALLLTGTARMGS